MGDEGMWAEMFKDKIPQFSTTYYQYTFNDNRSIYKFDRYDEKSKLPRGFGMGNPEDDVWYNDYTTGAFSNYRFILGDNYLLSGALMNIDWKLTPNETREIAGFNCRKATGIIFDSVYVFAFYTDEITISGGPMGIHGLPGMILEVAIPRLYTTWIATKIELVQPKEEDYKFSQKGKKVNSKELYESMSKSMEDWKEYGPRNIWWTTL